MGDVLLVYRISVEDQDKLDEVHEAIKKVKSAKYDKSQIEELFFGIKAIKASFIIPDRVEGAMSKLEEELNAIPNVKNISNEGTTLI